MAVELVRVVLLTLVMEDLVGLVEEEVTPIVELDKQDYNQHLLVEDMEMRVETAHHHHPNGVEAVAVELANKEKMEVHHVEDTVVMGDYMILVEQTDTMRVVVQEQTATTQTIIYNLAV